MPHDEVAFITGAGSGIGAATAVELSGRGAKVGLFDLDEAGLHRTEAEIAAAGGRRSGSAVMWPTIDLSRLE